MAPALVQSLLQGSSNSFGSSLVLSGSKVVSSGNTIFLAFTPGAASGSCSAADNLGNTYALVKSTYSANGYGAFLWRANITNPGTLTTITITHPAQSTRAAIAVEMSGVGALRNASFGDVFGQTDHPSLFPGPNEGSTATYVADDLWLGVLVYRNSTSDVVPYTSGDSIPSSEPTPQQAIGTNRGIALFYYTSPTGLASRRMLASYADFGSREYISVGAAIQAAPTGPKYNDVATGAIVFTGTVVESWQRGIVISDAPTGAVALGGSVVESSYVRTVYADAPTGTFVFTGSAVESVGKGFTDARSGTVLLSGSRTEKFNRADAPSGVYALKGTRTESWFIRTVYNDAPTGSIGFAGTRTESYIYRPAGRLPISGTCVERNTHTRAATGAIKSHGWAAEPTPASAPRPVGVPGDLVTSAPTVANPTILRPPTGSGYEPGDVLICFAAGFQGAVLAQQPENLPPGWTIGRAGTDPLYLLGKVAESTEEPPPTLIFSTIAGGGGTPVMARIVAFRNLDTRDMASIADVVGNVNNLTSAGQSAGGAAITTEYDNDLVLSLTRRQVGAQVNRLNPPAGFGLVSWAFIDSGQRMTTGWAYQVKRPAGLVAAPLFGVSTPDGTQYQTFGVAIALKATAVEEHHSTPSGTIKLAGSRVERRGYVEKPSGRIVVTGAVAAESHAHRPQITGTLKLSGTVQESWSHIAAVAGSMALSGTVREAERFSDAVTGDLVVAGTVEERYRLNNFDTCSGVLRLAGVWSEQLVISDDADGRLRLSGSKSEFITIDDAIFYDDFPADALEIDGRIVFVNEIVLPGRGGRVVYGIQTGRIVRAIEPGRVVGNLTGRVT